MSVFMLIFVGVLTIVVGGVATSIAAHFILREDTAGAFVGGFVAMLVMVGCLLSATKSGYVATASDAMRAGAALYLVAATVAVTHFARTRLWQGFAVALGGLALLAAALFALDETLGVVDIARENLFELTLD